MNTEPTLVTPFRACDDRGIFENIDFTAYLVPKRIYIVKNIHQNMVRAWHGHLYENKIIYPIKGTIKVAVGKMKVSPDSKQMLGFETPKVFVVSDRVQNGVFVPAGYVNGIQFLESDTTIMVLSSSSVEESRTDDYRWDYDTLYKWEVLCR